MKDLLTVALPSLMVLVGILLNRNDATRLDARITSLESNMSSQFKDIRGEIQNVRGEISATRDLFHSDVLMLMGRDQDQDRRITRLEERA